MSKPKRPRKGRKITLLPSILTTGNIFCGFYALIAAIEGHYPASSVAILIAMIFDILDGRVARFTGTSSRFGLEYDSLCDLVSFGVAPAILVFTYALKPYGRYGWLAAFVYVATTALRLARFNTQSYGEKNFFSGLPSPAAAGLVASSILFTRWLGFEQPVKHVALLLMVYTISYLMVSGIPYFSFKRITFAERHPFYALVAFVLLLALIATEPPLTIFLGFILYVLSGPLLLGLRVWRGHKVAISSEV